MALKFVDVQVNRKRMICIYGANGAGKTHLAMTAKGKKLLIDYYGNIETCLKFPRTSYEVVEGPEDYSKAIALLKDPDIGQFSVIILDNLTGMNRLFVKNIQDSGLTKSAKGSGHLGELPNMADYSLASERIRLVVTQLHRMAKEGLCHVIMIAHQQTKEIKDDNDNIVATECGPSVPGQVPAHILSLSAELIYIGGGVDNRYAYLADRGRWPAATRLLDPTKSYKNPNLSEMYKDYWS